MASTKQFLVGDIRANQSAGLLSRAPVPHVALAFGSVSLVGNLEADEHKSTDGLHRRPEGRPPTIGHFSNLTVVVLFQFRYIALCKWVDSIYSEYSENVHRVTASVPIEDMWGAQFSSLEDKRSQYSGLRWRGSHQVRQPET